jgi:hypothetical protein
MQTSFDEGQLVAVYADFFPKKGKTKWRLDDIIQIKSACRKKWNQ